MEDKILQAIIMMIKEGGTLAIWGILAYGLIGILKIVSIGGIIWLVISGVKNMLCHYWDSNNKQRSKEVSLISKEASDSLMECLKKYSEKLQRILTDVEKRLDLLDKKLNGKAKQTKQ